MIQLVLKCLLCSVVYLFLIDTLAYGQGERMETIVVTGTKLDADEIRERPSAALRVRADFVVFEVTYVNSNLDLSDRRAELEQTYEQLDKAISKDRTLQLFIGNAESRAPSETASFEDVYRNRGQQAYLNFVLEVTLQKEETFRDVRKRVDGLLDGIAPIGLTQSYVGDEQYLGLRNPSRHRPKLIETIWQDIYLSAGFADNINVKVEGLERRTQTLQVDALHVDLFIPYTVEFTADLNATLTTD